MPEAKPRLRIRAKPFFKWFDFWVGLYVDRAGQSVYICLLPTLGLEVSWWFETRSEKDFIQGWKQAVEFIAETVKLGDSAEQAIERARSIGD